MSVTLPRFFEILEPRTLFSTGDLDLSFAGGSLLQDFAHRNDFGMAVAAQSDDKLVLAGWISSGTSTGNDFALARFNADGSLDGSFGSGGKVVTDLGSTSDSAFSLAIQSDGKIVIVGQTKGSTTNFDFAMVRYNADGSLDSSFGSGGKVVTDFSQGSDHATSVKVMNDGRIVLGGWTTIAGVPQFAAARYTSSGQLDSTFGTSGRAVIAFSNGSSQANAMAIMSDGSLILAGTLTDNSSFTSDFAAVHITSVGLLDSSFGSSGWAKIDLGGDSESAYAVAIQSDGKVLLAGESNNTDIERDDFGLARLNANGSLDTSFGSLGTVLTDFDGDHDQAAAISFDSAGKILLAGSALISGKSCFALAKYNIDGSLDASFTGGKVTHAFTGDAFTSGMAIDSQNRIIVAGYAYNAPNAYDFAAARFIGAVVNVPPVANAGGAYLVNSGASIPLDGSASTDSDGAVVSYEWDFNYNGTTFDIDGTGLMPTFSAANLSGPLVRTIALRVTDNNGAMSIATTTLRVNAAPTANAGGVYLTNSGASLQLNGTASTDIDGSIASYEWDFNYDGSTFDSDATGATPTFSAANLSGPLVRTIALRVTDNNGATSIATTTLRVNAAPTANAGGVYLTNSGASLQLNGAASTDIDGTIASYEWDFDYDGSTFDSDATGATPTFSAANLSGPLVRTIALRVTDNNGATSIATTTLRVNAAPTANAGGAYFVDSGANINLNASGSMDVDGTIMSYEWDFNYDGSTFDSDTTGAAPTFSAANLTGPLVRMIALRVTDDNGATSIAITTITVNAPKVDPVSELVTLQTDPDNSGKSILILQGTTGSDSVVFKKGKKGAIEVRMNGKILGTFANIGRIVAYGGDGNDRIDASEVGVSVVLFGGKGNDRLTGSKFSDILVGGAGNDRIFGNRGDDLLIGGTGKDEIHSRFGNDLMVGGSLTFENNLSSLRAVLSEWTRTDLSMSKRMSHLTRGGGINGSTVLDAVSAPDDQERDVLNGTPNVDGFVTGAGDKIVRLR